MGCGSGKDVKITADMQIRVMTIQTGIIEFDQIFLLLAEAFTEAEQIRQNVVPARYNMIRIVKAHHLNNPTVVDAYRLWTYGMSCCNQGKSKSHGVKYNFSDDHSKFDYDTGISGEFRFDWFGDYLNAYLDGVAKAAVTFPLVKQKVLDMFDRIKGMKNQILIYASVFPQLSDKLKAGALVTLNVANFSLGMKICVEFSKNLEQYNNEIQDLIKHHKQIEDEADETGMRIFDAYGVLELEKITPSEKTRYRMKRQMNDVVQHYTTTERRTVEEQTEDSEHKLARSKVKPRKNKNYLPNDLPCDLKHFPWRLRWVGCNVLDLPMQQMSVALQDHQIQKTKLKLYRSLIVKKLELYYLEEESMTQAFQIFLWALTEEKGSLKEKLSIKDESPYCIGLDKIKSKNADLEEVRGYFLQYFYLCSHDRRGPLDESWGVFNAKFALMENWSRGEFTNYEPFKQSTLPDQYNMMSSVAKNIYALRAYKPVAAKVYEKGFKRLKEESEKFWGAAQGLINNADQEASKYKGAHVKDIAAKLHPGAKNSNEKVGKRKDKVDKTFDDFKAKQ